PPRPDRRRGRGRIAEEGLPLQEGEDPCAAADPARARLRRPPSRRRRRDRRREAERVRLRPLRGNARDRRPDRLAPARARVRALPLAPGAAGERRGPPPARAEGAADDRVKRATVVPAPHAGDALEALLRGLARAVPGC